MLLVGGRFTGIARELCGERESVARYPCHPLSPGGFHPGHPPVSSGTKTKVTIPGFTPGEFQSFKVTASVNNQTSPASNIASITNRAAP